MWQHGPVIAPIWRLQKKLQLCHCFVGWNRSWPLDVPFGQRWLQTSSEIVHLEFDILSSLDAASRWDPLSNLWITILLPQVFSALTMLLPALHGYALAPEIALDASFPPGDSACVTFHDFSLHSLLLCLINSWMHWRNMGVALCDSFSLPHQHGLSLCQCNFRGVSWRDKCQVWEFYDQITGSWTQYS